jgi:sarcosine oxidase subunit alpha
VSELSPGSIELEGRPVPFHPGDTIAAALLRSGVTAFSRGPKYHRPRGPFCLAGTCAQCHMRVGGEPDVPTCITPANPGLQVERQNALGSADLDLLRAVDFLYPEGLDHHHLMTRFKLLNSAAQVVARRLAGIGQIPSARPEARTLEKREAAVVIVGAGPAGLAAASAAVESGARPLVLEARSQPGGWANDGFSRDPSAAPDKLEALARRATSRIELLLGTSAAGLYAEGGRRYLLGRAADRLYQIAFDRIVIATGGNERPLPFESNDLAGVFAGRGLCRLVREHGVAPGKRVVIVATDPDGERVARLLGARGVQVVAVVSSSAVPAPEFPVLMGTPRRAVGRTRVTALRVREPSGTERVLRCDIIAVTGPRSPSYELAAEAGLEAVLDLEAGGFVLKADQDGRTEVPWIFAAGTAAGRGGESVASGLRAGRAAAAELRATG